MNRTLPLAPLKSIDQSFINDETPEEVSIILKRYQRPLKLLFNKYASTGYKPNNLRDRSFD